MHCWYALELMYISQKHKNFKINLLQFECYSIKLRME